MRFFFSFLQSIFDKKIFVLIICINKNKIGITNIKVGITKNKVGITNIKAGITKNKVGNTNIKIGITKNKVGITNIKVGITKNKVGITNIKVWITYINVGIVNRYRFSQSDGQRILEILLSPKLWVGICCLSDKHAALRRKNKDWLNRNHDNVS